MTTKSENKSAAVAYLAEIVRSATVDSRWDDVEHGPNAADIVAWVRNDINGVELDRACGAVEAMLSKALKASIRGWDGELPESVSGFALHVADLYAGFVADGHRDSMDVIAFAAALDAEAARFLAEAVAA